MYWEEQKKIIGDGLLKEKNLLAVIKYAREWFKKNPCCIAKVEKSGNGGISLAIWQDKGKESLHSLNFNEIHIPFTSVLDTDSDGNLRIVLPDGSILVFGGEGEFTIFNKYITLDYKEARTE